MEAKTYTTEEIRKLAPGYRGKPEKFDPAKVGKKFPAQRKPKTSGPATREVTAPTATDRSKPTPQKNNPMWTESIFGIDVSVRELEVDQTLTPTFARLPEIIDEIYTSLSGDDVGINKSISKNMLMYYATTLLWTRLIDNKARRGKESLSYVETEFLRTMLSHEYNIPQPLYLFLKSIGEVKDASGKTVYLQTHDLPQEVVQGFGGYYSSKIDALNHNMYEEVPSLGICGDILMAESSEDNNPTPTFRVLPKGTEATTALAGYYGPIGSRKEEIRISLNAMGITATSFDEIIPKTRLNIKIVQKVSDYLVSSKTFRNEKVKFDALTTEGDSILLIKSIPTLENKDENAKWTNLVVRPTAANANSVTTFGATYIMGFQLYKTDINKSSQNWCCLKAKPAERDPWTIPAEWIENRNDRRRLPSGMDVERFSSISDSQRVRTNAITRRMIVSIR